MCLLFSFTLLICVFFFSLVDKYMIIPWLELPTETLENIVESVVLREGTDYCSH